MKLSTVLFSTAIVASVSSLPVRRDVDPNLVPDLGFTAGKNPTGTGDCDGAVNGSDGKPIKIPCSCPPDRQTFLKALNADVAAGHAVNNPSVKVSFPTDNSVQSQHDRITAAVITLQNLNGPGKGCPIVSTTLSAQSDAIDAAAKGVASSPSSAPKATSSPAPKATSLSPSAVSASPSAAPASPAGGVDPNLVPDLGFTAGKNPTGTGDCDGAVNGSDGKPIKIPCSCPPDRQTFLKALNADVAAGHAVNNPSVKVTFPTDNSIQSQHARITAAVITLQNLHGPGKGCPIVSTTLSAQSDAIDAAAKGAASPAPALKPTPSPAPAPKPLSSSRPVAPTSSAAPSAPATSPAGGVDPNLVPDLGFTAGKNPTGTGDCDGAVNGKDSKPIKIPCSCPPDRQTFLKALNADVAAGHAVHNPSVKVTFPTDNSIQSQHARITAAVITLQNLNGPGKGCPIVSTTLSAQSDAIDAAAKGAASPAPAPKPAPSPAPAPAPKPVFPSPPIAAAPSAVPAAPATPAASPAGGVDPNLVPDLGFTAGKNPTGTGDCDGAVNVKDGKPIKVPCSCPPDRQTFLKALNADVAAGHAVHNPSVKVTFPTDNSVQSQHARITAAVITLQNLNGPGKGCPIVSTTLSAQSDAIDAAAKGVA